jgi:hypothetical protein
MKLQDKITLSVAEAVKKVLAPDVKLSEGKMKELHALMKKGVKDPKKIAKELGLANTKEVFAAIEALIKKESEIAPADQDKHDMHSVDAKADPEQEKQTEDAETDAEDAIDDNKKELEKTAPEQMKTEAKLAEYDFEEGNEFTAAAAKAKLAGEDEFEFDGKTYPTEISQDAAKKILGKTEARGGPPPLLTKKDVERNIKDNDDASFYRGWTSDGNPMQLILKRYLVKKMNKGDDYDPYFDGTSLVGPGFSGKTALAGALDPKKGYKVKDLLKALKKFKD